MEIVIDRDKCIASGACVIASPEIFDQDADGIAILAQATPGPELLRLALDAAAVCPATAIVVDA